MYIQYLSKTGLDNYYRPSLIASNDRCKWPSMFMGHNLRSEHRHAIDWPSLNCLDRLM